ncbi:MAG: hypothetical protein RIB59_02740 [Rhodospirillales bacterium]
MIKLISRIFGGKSKKETAAKPAKKPAAPKKNPADVAAADKGTQPSTIEQLEAASAALEKAAGAAPDTAPGAAKAAGPREALTVREKLIRNALSIHREKSKILDSLPPAVRTKLTAMAMALYIQQRSDKGKH